MRKFLLFALLSAMVLSAVSQTKEWSIVETYTIPGKASGLAYDGQYLYFGIYGSGGENMYRFDPASGQATLQFSNPEIDDTFGLTWDGQFLWLVNQPSGSSNPALATKVSMTGDILETFALPDHYMSGIAYDDGQFWSGTYYPDPGTIHLTDNQGAVINQFTAPDEQIWDICVQEEFLWMVDYNANFIFKTDKDGNVIDGYDCENIKPSGIVFDGLYLWYVDGQLSSESTLYKIDLGGSGTPVIKVTPTVYDYGNVTIGDEKTLELNIENEGSADLVVSGLDIPSWSPLTSSTAFPLTIPPFESRKANITYIPESYGEMKALVDVLSNDPVTPEVEVDLSGFGVEDGPTVYIGSPSHNYGDIRENAFTRWFMKIENHGDELLTIENIESNNPNFMVDESVTFPILLPSRGEYEAGIWFNPTDTEEYDGVITITSSDPVNTTTTVSVEGTGVFHVYVMGEQIWEYLIDTDYDNSPKGIETIGDVTGDGVDDVIICSEDDYVRCFNGNSGPWADVMWEKEIEYGNVYDQPSLQIVSDMNGDGYQDVVIGTAWANKKVICMSGKNGLTEWEYDTQNFGEGGWVYMVDVSQDYNGDGHNDVLAATGNNQDNTGSKRVLCLDVLTGDLIWQSYLGGAVFSVIGVGDITGDGIPDAVAGATDPGETQGYVYGINGTNGIQFWTVETSGSSVWALLELEDANGDDVNEVVAGDFQGVYYHIDPVDGEVLNTGSIYNSIILRFEALDDVDGDGYFDFTIAHSKTNAVAVSGYDASVIWSYGLPDKCWNVAPIPDISGDNISDIVAGTLFGDNYVVYINGVDGEELTSVPVTSPVDALWVTDDVTGDNSWEVVVGCREGEVYCLSGGQSAGTGMPLMEPAGFAASISPNPFTNYTEIAFVTERQSTVDIIATDINGRRWIIAGNLIVQKGTTNILWDGVDAFGNYMPKGIYLITLYGVDNQQTLKVLKK